MQHNIIFVRIYDGADKNHIFQFSYKYFVPRCEKIKYFMLLALKAKLSFLEPLIYFATSSEDTVNLCQDTLNSNAYSSNLFVFKDKCDGDQKCRDWTDEVADCRECPSKLFPNPCGCNTPEAGYNCTEVACYSS